MKNKLFAVILGLAVLLPSAVFAAEDKLTFTPIALVATSTISTDLIDRIIDTRETIDRAIWSKTEKPRDLFIGFKDADVLMFANASTTCARNTVYKVSKGDTPAGIAKRFKTTLDPKLKIAIGNWVVFCI